MSYIILSILFAPFLPFTTQALHKMLGYEDDLSGQQEVVEYQEQTRSHTGLTYHSVSQGDRWQPSQLAPGQPLRQPVPLFRKLEPEMVAQEVTRLGKPAD